MERDPKLYSPDHVFAEMAYDNLTQEVKMGEIYHKAKQALTRPVLDRFHDSSKRLKTVLGFTY